MLQARVPLLLDLPESAWFDVELMHKDIRLALEAAPSLDVTLPAAATADDMLAKARELGYGERDIAALHQVLARLSDGDGPDAAASRRSPAIRRDDGRRADRGRAAARAAAQREGAQRDPRGGRRAAAAPRTRRGEHGRGGRDGPA